MSHLPFNFKKHIGKGQVVAFLFIFSIGFLKAQKVGINTETPTAGLHVISNEGLLITGEYGMGAIQTDGYGTRMMFSPKTASFRVGRLTDDDGGAYENWWNFFNTGDYSFVSGVNSRAMGYASFASGYKNQALEEGTFVAGGQSNIASGRRSFVTGYQNTASSFAEAVFGMNALEYTPQSIASYVGTDRLFVVGNGELNSSRSNAMTIMKNGNTGIGTAFPLSRLHVDGNTIVDDSLRVTNLRVTNGAGSGHVLVSDVNGNGSWTDPSLLSSAYWSEFSGKIYRNSNVGINTNNPLAPLHTVGEIRIQSGRLTFALTSGSILIGTDAGLNNAGNDNVFVGESAGGQNTTGSHNIAIGYTALQSNTTGGSNISIGRYSLNGNITGSNNIGIGPFALLENNGFVNVAIGSNAMELNESGEENVAVGGMSGYNSAGDGNTFLGYSAGHETLGDGNVLIGRNAGYNETGSNKLYIANSNTSEPLIYGDFSTKHLIINDSLTAKKYKVNGGRIEFENTGNSVFIGEEAGKDDDLSTNNNVFIGHQAGKANSTGANNIAIGSNALDNASNTFYNIAFGQDVLGHANLTGNNNTGIGNFSLNSNTTGNENTAIGQSALGQNTSGIRNVSIGNYSSDATTIGSYNTVVGYEALGENQSGQSNVALGYNAGHNATGNQNTFLGFNTGLLNASGTGNVFLGNEAGFNETGSNKLYIDNSGTSSPLIHGDFSINKVIINDSLATKYLQITNGASNNFILKSDNTGKGSWSEASLLFHNTTSNNLFIGDEVGDMVTTAVDNTIVGPYAGVDLTTGYENTGFGFWSLLNLTTGTSNTAIGHNSLANNITGSNNTALGWSALAGSTGSYNSGLGGGAGGENTVGSRNVYLGYNAGFNNQGSDNIFIGHKAGEDETGSNKLYIDNTDSASPLIYGDFSTNEVTINDSLTVGKELSVGTSIAKSTFEVNGSVAVKFKTPLVAGTDQPDDTGMVWRYNSGTGTITLPAASTCVNRIYVIINQTGTTRTISTFRNLTTSSQTTIGSSISLWLMSDGTEWWQIK